MPLASWMRLRGRCARCGGLIHPVHPLCEAAGLAVGVSAALVAPGWAGVAGAMFGWLLLALAAVDARAMWLPNQLTGALALAGLAVGVTGLVPPPLAARAIGGLAGFAVLEALRRGYRLWRGREGIGGGDPKMLGGIGLWLGWQPLPIVMLVACALGLGFAFGWRTTGRRVRADTRLPLGTLMAAGGYAVWLLSIR